MNEKVYFLLFFACQCIGIPINHNDKFQVHRLEGTQFIVYAVIIS